MLRVCKALMVVILLFGLTTVVWARPRGGDHHHMPPSTQVSSEYFPTPLQLEYLSNLALTIGLKEDFGYLLQVGRPFVAGTTASFLLLSDQGGFLWGITDWEVLPDGRVKKTEWQFANRQAIRRVMIYDSYGKVLDAEDATVHSVIEELTVAKSKECWRLLMSLIL